MFYTLIRFINFSSKLSFLRHTYFQDIHIYNREITNEMHRIRIHMHNRISCEKIRKRKRVHQNPGTLFTSTGGNKLSREKDTTHRLVREWVTRNVTRRRPPRRWSTSRSRELTTLVAKPTVRQCMAVFTHSSLHVGLAARFIASSIDKSTVNTSKKVYETRSEAR